MEKHVYFTCRPPNSLVDFVQNQDCHVHFASRLIEESPHCNKLIPFLNSDDEQDQIVTDADVFLVRDIAPLLKSDRIRLAPNNHGNPPYDIFKTLFETAGLPTPEPGVALFGHGKAGFRETYVGNVSAGVIAVPARMRQIVERWHHWAIWLVSHLDLLGRFRVHVDQISFALALEETQARFEFLPPQANAILQILPQINELYALHLTSGHIHLYPQWFNAQGHLQTALINDRLSEPLERFNQVVDQARDVMQGIPEIRDFAANLLNPDYKR